MTASTVDGVDVPVASTGESCPSKDADGGVGTVCQPGSHCVGGVEGTCVPYVVGLGTPARGVSIDGNTLENVHLAVNPCCINYTADSGPTLQLDTTAFCKDMENNAIADGLRITGNTITSQYPVPGFVYGNPKYCIDHPTSSNCSYYAAPYSVNVPIFADRENQAHADITNQFGITEWCRSKVDIWLADNIATVGTVPDPPSP